MAHRIMLVDDEEDIIWGLTSLLNRSGFNAVSAANGEEALEKLSTEPVDVLVTDIKMPKMSGLDLIMHAHKEYPNLKIIVMTARGSPETENEAMERGAVVFLEKPFDLNDFLDAIKRAERAGFRGVVQDLQLVDILQILNMEKANASVEVMSPDGDGTIYFSDGELVHAVCGEETGEAAFGKVLTLEGGHFQLKRDVECEERTIETSLDNLLLSFYAKADETAAKSEGATDGSAEWSFTDALEAEGETSAPTVRLSEETLAHMKASAGEVLKEDGRELIVTRGGVELFRAENSDVGAEVGSVVEELLAIVEKGGVGAGRELILAAKEGFVLGRKEGGVTVVALIGPKGNPGKARAALEACSPKIAEMLKQAEEA